MDFDGYDVYVKINGESRIIAINSSAFIDNFTDWILIESGVHGDRGHHAQGNYFPEPIITMGGAYRYKLVDGVVVECTAEEIAEQEAENQKPATAPTVWDELDAAYQEGYDEGYTEGVNSAYDE